MQNKTVSPEKRLWARVERLAISIFPKNTSEQSNGENDERYHER